MKPREPAVLVHFENGAGGRSLVTNRRAGGALVDRIPPDAIRYERVGEPRGFGEPSLSGALVDFRPGGVRDRNGRQRLDEHAAAFVEQPIACFDPHQRRGPDARVPDESRARRREVLFALDAPPA